MKNAKPVVSVCLITYNHARYIKQAIDSILLQDADFDWDIIIADDCSTDGTREIIRDYANLYPDKIRLILQEKNVGIEKNVVDLFTSPDSKYFAFLDGDDIWIDPKRLQKQVDFLENNPSYGMVYGKYTLMNEAGENVPLKRYPDYKSGYLFEDIILLRYLPPLASSLIRMELVQQAYQDRSKPGFDFYLLAAVAKESQVKYIDEPYYCYRMNNNSITQVSYQGIYDLVLRVISLYEKEYPGLVKKARRNAQLAYVYNTAENRPGFSSLVLLIRHFSFSSRYFRQLAKCFLRLFSH